MYFGIIPSVFATAIMIHVIKDLKPREQVEYQSHQLMTLLKVNQHNPSKKRMMNWLGVSTLMTAQMVPGMSLLLQYHPLKSLRSRGEEYMSSK
ncbi:hypothetical protein F2Q70_00034850 [Brassica cretica]|uniref:Uncharacterized protein n=1 Tax=Brassica cretica TaxID=69181 RepID=A0A8S9JUP1_BRACR|nr:hypothetical protein F2Q68_00029747 [Brassica cretica]KAF2585754.1 hypothetical protein F2Q70_00034850 [Brassica cretica]KAF3604782.1 hypothetical protein F2Q69_00033728 [Brassica cretica]